MYIFYYKKYLIKNKYVEVVEGEASFGKEEKPH